MARPLFASAAFTATNDAVPQYQHGTRIEIARSVDPVAVQANRTIRVSTQGTIIDNSAIEEAQSPLPHGIGGLVALDAAGIAADSPVRVLGGYLYVVQVVDPDGESDASTWHVHDFSPRTANAVVNVTTSTSFGVNLGMFGETPNGGVSFGTSSTTSWNVEDYNLQASAGMATKERRGPFASWGIHRNPGAFAPAIAASGFEPKLEAVFAQPAGSSSRYTYIATAAMVPYDDVKPTPDVIDKLKASPWANLLGTSGIGSLAGLAARAYMKATLTSPQIEQMNHSVTAVVDSNVVYTQLFCIDWETGAIFEAVNEPGGAKAGTFVLSPPVGDCLMPAVQPKATASIETSSSPMRSWSGSDALVAFADVQSADACELRMPVYDVSVLDMYGMHVGEGLQRVDPVLVMPFTRSIVVPSVKGEKAIFVMEPPAIQRGLRMSLDSRQHVDAFSLLPEAPQGISDLYDGGQKVDVMWRDHIVTLHQGTFVDWVRPALLSRIEACGFLENGAMVALSGERLYYSTDAFDTHIVDLHDTKIQGSDETVGGLLREARDPARPPGIVAVGNMLLLLGGDRILRLDLQDPEKPAGEVKDRAAERATDADLAGVLRAATAFDPRIGVPVGVDALVDGGPYLVLRATGW